MGRIRWMAPVALLIAGTLAVAACNDDRKSDGGETGGKTPVAEGTKAGGDGKTAEPEATKNDAGTGGAASDLQEVADKFASSTFHAVYEISGADLGGIANGQITIFKDGKDKLRFDIKGEQDGQTFEASFIETGSESYLCLAGEAAAGLGALTGGDTSAGLCMKSSPDDPTNPVGSLLDDIEFDADGVELQDTEKKKIAGEDAICYTVLRTGANETDVACFNDEGALLSVEGGGPKLVATSAEGDVSDGDFEPPYPVQEIPGLGQ